MKAFFVLLLLMACLTPALSIRCSVGKQDQTVMEDGFNYCTTTMDQLTKEISYGGGFGPTDFFKRMHHSNAKHFCWHDFNQPNYGLVSCYCKDQNGCNQRVDSDGFNELMFAARSI